MILYLFLMYLIWEILAEHLFKWCVQHDISAKISSLLSVLAIWFLGVGVVHLLTHGEYTWVVLWLSIFWVPIIYLHIRYPDDFDMDL